MMRSKTDIEIEEKGLEVRRLIADIIPLLDRIPSEAVDEVVSYVSAALSAAQRSLEAVLNGKKDRE